MAERYHCGTIQDFRASAFAPRTFYSDVDRDRDHPDQPELAQAQIAQSATWKHSGEFCPNWAHTSEDLEPQDIAQRIVSDCSVCASIVVCLVHHKRFSSKVSSLRHFGPRYSSIVIARTVIPPSTPRRSPGRVTEILPLRCRILPQRE